MSTELYSPAGSAEHDAGLQGTTVGGSKPLHRFIRGQPKIVGIIVVILGSPFIIVPLAMKAQATVHHTFSVLPPPFLMGTLFIICGILFILTEHNPTKKTVTISLAFSIVTILTGCWSALHAVIDLGNGHYYDYDYESNTTDTEDNYGNSHSMFMEFTLEAIFTFYSLAGIIIFIVMSSLAGAALRTTKSQAIVVMTTAQIEMPVE